MNPTDIQLRLLAIATLALIDWSPVYAVEPLGLVLGNSAAVALPWSQAYPPSGVLNPEAANIAIYFSADGSCFTPLTQQLGNAGFSTGTLPQLGFLIAGAPRTPSTATCP